MFRRDFIRTTAVGAAALGLSACSGMSTGSGNDIVDVASANGSFDTLVAAVAAADLVDTLKSPGPFTVFAPTDEAFAALPAGTVENLLKPENKDQLVAILTYHVVPQKIDAADIPAGRSRVKTVAGGYLSLDTSNGVTVNGANVTTADVGASNGVIHVVDEVLLP